MDFGLSSFKILPTERAIKNEAYVPDRMSSCQYVLAFEKAFNQTSVRTTSWKLMNASEDMPLEAYTLLSSDCKWLVVYDSGTNNHTNSSSSVIERSISAAERVWSVIELRLMILEFLDLSALCRLSSDHGLRTTIQKHRLLKTARRDGLSPDYYVRVGMLRFMGQHLQGDASREGAMKVGPQLRAYYYHQ